MKQVLYGNLVHKSVGELEKEGAGSLLTKAVSDVDACVEGIRKFTTEIFDTGIALLAYAAMLLWYDWRTAVSVVPAVFLFDGGKDENRGRAQQCRI